MCADGVGTSGHGSAQASSAAGEAPSGEASVEEGLELLRAFRAIPCAETRARLLAAVVGASRQQTDDTR